LGVVVVIGNYLPFGARMREFLHHVQLLLDGGGLVAGSFGYRLELALTGWRTFLEQPLLGHGQAQYMDAVRVRSLPGALDLSQFGHLHNDYIAHMVSFGFFGLVFLVAYLALTLWLVARSGHGPYRRAGFGLLAMLAVYMVPEIAFNMDPITGCLTLAFGAILSMADPETVTVRPSVTIGQKSTKSA
jgi:O-antigen ligase